MKPNHTTIFAAISEPLGINGCALATFPEYVLVTERCLHAIFDTFQKSNMAVGKPEIQDTCECITATNETSMATPIFLDMPDLDIWHCRH